MRLLLIFVSFLSATVGAKPMLQLPYYDWGRCPFEGCTYQEWTTKQDIIVRAEPTLTAKELFSVPRDQKVQGLTGVVITESTGTVKVIKPIKIGYNDKGEGPLLNMRAGEQIDILGWVGEGAGLFWYKGKTYTLDYDPERSELEYGPPPKNHWWVKIKDYKGL